MVSAQLRVFYMFKNVAYNQLIGNVTLPTDAVVTSMKLSGTLEWRGPEAIKTGSMGFVFPTETHFVNKNGTSTSEEEAFVFDFKANGTESTYKTVAVRTDCQSTGTLRLKDIQCEIVYETSSPTITLTLDGMGSLMLMYGNVAVHTIQHSSGKVSTETVELPYNGEVKYFYWIKVIPANNNKVDTITLIRSNGQDMSKNYGKEEYNFPYNLIMNGSISVQIVSGGSEKAEYKALKNPLMIEGQRIQDVRYGTNQVTKAYNNSISSNNLISLNSCYKSNEILRYDYAQNYPSRPRVITGSTKNAVYEYGIRNEDNTVTRNVYRSSYWKRLNGLSIEHPGIIRAYNVRNLHYVDSLATLFWNCVNLESVDIGYNPSIHVTNMASAFNGCSKIKYIDLGRLDLHNVTTYFNFAAYCKELKEIRGINITNINTKKSDCLRSFATNTKLNYLSVYSRSYEALAYMLNNIRRQSDGWHMLDDHTGQSGYTIDISTCPKYILDKVKENFVLDGSATYGWVIKTSSGTLCTKITLAGDLDTTFHYNTEGAQTLDLATLLPVKAYPTAVTEPITWSSSNRNAGYFKDERSGIFTVGEPGETVITVKCGLYSAKCKLALDFTINNPTITIENHKAVLSKNGYKDIIDVSYEPNTYAPNSLYDYDSVHIQNGGLDYYLNTHRTPMEEDISLFRINGYIPQMGGYWEDIKEDGSPYEIIKYAYVPTSNNMNFTYDIKYDTSSESGYEELAQDGLDVFNGFLEALNVSFKPSSSNTLTFAGYNDTWLGLTTSYARGYFEIRMNTRTLEYDYGKYSKSNTKWLSTMVHELGHTLGFDDDAIHTPTMYNKYRNRDKCVWLQPNDRVAYKELMLNTYGVDVTKSQKEITAQWLGMGGASKAAYNRRGVDDAVYSFDYNEIKDEELESLSDVVVDGTLEFIETKMINIGTPSSPFRIKYDIYNIKVIDILKGELIDTTLKVPHKTMPNLTENVNYRMYLKQFKDCPNSFINARQGFVRI